jgi:Ca2+-binding EF-hand superfamily protein
MVDQLLDQYDVNFDGFLDYAEFMKSFEEARQKLGL